MWKVCARPSLPTVFCRAVCTPHFWGGWGAWQGAEKWRDPTLRVVTINLSRLGRLPAWHRIAPIRCLYLWWPFWMPSGVGFEKLLFIVKWGFHQHSCTKFLFHDWGSNHNVLRIKKIIKAPFSLSFTDFLSKLGGWGWRSSLPKIFFFNLTSTVYLIPNL